MDDAAPARMADLTPHAPETGATAVLAEMSSAYRTLLEAVGEDPEREGLLRTPLRAAKAFSFLTQGYGQNLETLVNGAVFASENREMVIVNNIEFHSLCEHHLLPFSGRAHVAYLPSGHVIGLSKIPRIVDMFARRLQIQENMTRQIAECLLSAVQADGVAVVLEGQHQCMMMRGVEKQQASMTTSAMLGRFRDDARTRGEFLSLIRQRS